MEEVLARVEQVVDSVCESWSSAGGWRGLWRDMVGEEQCMQASQDERHLEWRGMLLEEYTQLAMYTEGILMVPQATLTTWEGLVFVTEEDSAYRDGVFKFRLEISCDYPNVAPEVYFQSILYHPLVCVHTGKLDISKAFPRWKAGRDYLALVVAFVRSIFKRSIYCDGSSFNPEAAVLLKDNGPEFERRAKETAQCSIADLWHCSEHDDVLTFEPVEELKMSRLLNALRRADGDYKNFINMTGALLDA